MSASYDLEVAVPGTDMPGGDGPSFRRILVPVRSPGESAEALAAAARICNSTINGVLRLIHVRIYDPPMPRCPGPFYPETAAEATALLDEALLIVWGGGARATTTVVNTPRGEVAAQRLRGLHSDVLHDRLGHEHFGLVRRRDLLKLECALPSGKSNERAALRRVKLDGLGLGRQD